MNEGAQLLPLVEVADVARARGLWGGPAGWPWLGSDEWPGASPRLLACLACLCPALLQGCGYITRHLSQPCFLSFLSLRGRRTIPLGHGRCRGG